MIPPKGKFRSSYFHLTKIKTTRIRKIGDRLGDQKLERQLPKSAEEKSGCAKLATRVPHEVKSFSLQI
jgi:hypothetical protein